MGIFYKMVILSKFHTMQDITKEDFNNYINFYSERGASEFTDLNWFLFFFILLFDEKDAVSADTDFDAWYSYVQKVLLTLNDISPIDGVDMRLCEITLVLNTFPKTNWTTLKRYELVNYTKLVDCKCNLDNETDLGYFCWHEAVQYLMLFDAHEHQQNYRGLMDRISELNLTNELHRIVRDKYTQYIRTFDSNESNL